MIDVVDLVKHYGDRRVIDAISLRVDRGRVVCLVGPSGGGKSTLLRCLNGLENFDGGSVSVDGVRLEPGHGRAHHRALSALRRRVGFVFQQWNLFAHRDVLGNVIEAPLVVARQSRVDAERVARGLLERVGLSHRLNALPSELSGGEQQRVAIARALAMSPAVLLMDEPTSALDPERVAGVTKLLRELAEDGLTLVIVTHEMRFVREVADEVFVLHGGHVIESGEPAVVLDAPTDPRTRAFLGH